MAVQNDEFELHVRAFSKLLIKLRAELNNDLDLVLIMAVIAECHYMRLARFNSSNSLSADSARIDATPSINTLSVALYTEIPRETVRRKIGVLVEKGWVGRDAQGSLLPTSQAANLLAKGTAATLEYLAVVTEPDSSGRDLD